MMCLTCCNKKYLKIFAQFYFSLYTGANSRMRTVGVEKITAKQKRQAYRLIKLQLFSAIVMFLWISPLFGLFLAGSAAIGVAISLLANVCSAHRMFSQKQYEAKKILGDFYAGELRKILLTVILFIFCFSMLPISHLFLLVGYIVAQMSFLLMPLLMHCFQRASNSYVHYDVEQLS